VCSQFSGFRLGSFSSLESTAALKEFYERDGEEGWGRRGAFEGEGRIGGWLGIEGLGG